MSQRIDSTELAKFQIEQRIAEIRSDERFSYPPASVQVNAPLALIQVSMKSEVAGLLWALRCIRECSN